MCRLSYGAQRVYSPSPAVTREESTFNLEVAIRGGLLRVNITDKRDKKQKKERGKKNGSTGPQSWQVGSKVANTMRSPQRSACSGHSGRSAPTHSQIIYGGFLSTYVIISKTNKFKFLSIFTAEFKLCMVRFNQRAQSS